MEELVPALTSFGGSISRKTFWIGVGALVVASLVLGLIPYLGMVAPFALLYPWTCLAMQRLRDMGRAPALALIPVALSAVSTILALLTAASAVNPALIGVALLVGGMTVVVGMIAMVVAIGFLLWIGLTPGASDRPVAGGVQG